MQVSDPVQTGLGLDSAASAKETQLWLWSREIDSVTPQVPHAAHEGRKPRLHKQV